MVDELGAMRLAVHAAVSDAFHTPAVIQMFAKREPAKLRANLATMEVSGTRTVIPIGGLLGGGATAPCREAP